MRVLSRLLLYSIIILYPCINAFAQDIRGISPPPSPSAITPDQETPGSNTTEQLPTKLQVIENAISASGGSITQQQINAINNDSQLKNMDAQTIESLKTKYRYRDIDRGQISDKKNKDDQKMNDEDDEEEEAEDLPDK